MAKKNLSGITVDIACDTSPLKEAFKDLNQKLIERVEVENLKGIIKVLNEKVSELQILIKYQKQDLAYYEANEARLIELSNKRLEEQMKLERKLLEIQKETREDCKFCKRHKDIKIHRPENIDTYSAYVLNQFPNEDAAIFFQNSNGMPAYIDIKFCPFCGDKLRGEK